MIAKNTTMYQGCMACLNSQGQKKVVDCYFEDYNFVILSKCMACQGITKNIYQPMAYEYISGPRKAVYTGKGGTRA